MVAMPNGGCRATDIRNLRESDVLINEIDTLESALGRASHLKYGDKVRAIEIAEANNNYQQANRLRKQLIKIQDVESENKRTNTKLEPGSSTKILSQQKLSCKMEVC